MNKKLRQGKERELQCEVSNIIDMYLKEKSLLPISKKYNAHYTIISNILKSNNIKVERFRGGGKHKTRKYTLNENYFDTIDTEDKAYFLGLLYADGCNKNTRVTITLQEKDKNILDVFNKFLNHNKPLYIEKKSEQNPNWQDAYMLTISSKHLSDKLMELGCTNKKSLILKFPTEKQVPKNLWKHFIRGYFDGDGSINFNSKTNYPSCNICSTNNFCLSIQEFLKEINIESSIIKHTNNNGQPTRYLLIKGGQHQILKFLDFIYQDSTVYINRKYEKYILLKSNLEKSNDKNN